MLACLCYQAEAVLRQVDVSYLKVHRYGPPLSTFFMDVNFQTLFAFGNSLGGFRADNAQSHDALGVIDFKTFQFSRND